jgi:hypothetical protein
MPSPEQGFVTTAPEAAREPAGIAAGPPPWQRWATVALVQLAGIALCEVVARAFPVRQLVLLFGLALSPQWLLITHDVRLQ